jgi:hypothetical protein
VFGAEVGVEFAGEGLEHGAVGGISDGVVGMGIVCCNGYERQCRSRSMRTLPAGIRQCTNLHQAANGMR